MQFEEDFGLEIPDEDAEKILSVQQALDYIKANNREISYIGRSPDATPATGYAKRHLAQQKEIIDIVFN